MSQFFDDAIQARADQALADALGLTVEELAEADCTVDGVTNNDDLLVEYIVTFSDDCPASILEKVNGLSDGTVRLDPWIFETEDEPYD